MKTPGTRALTATGAVAFAIFLLWQFPAHLALRWFGPAELAAQGIEGTLWSGSAQTVQLDSWVLGETRWRIRPLQLFAGRFGARLETQLQGGALRGNVARSLGGRIIVRDAKGVMPLSALAATVPSQAVSGEIGLDIDSLAMTDGIPVEVNGTVDVVNLRLLAPVAEDLGSFELQFDHQTESPLAGAIRSLQGPLEATGTLTLDAEGGYVLDTLVTPKPGASEGLINVLRFAAPADSEGRHRVSFSGTY